MMKEKQTTDSVNSGKSGGVNHQGGTLSAMEHKAAGSSPAMGSIPAKGTSNGGK